MKTFVNVRAARRFADGMKTPFAKFSLQKMDGFKVRAALAEPLGQARTSRIIGRITDLNQSLGWHAPSFLHAAAKTLGSQFARQLR